MKLSSCSILRTMVFLSVFLFFGAVSTLLGAEIPAPGSLVAGTYLISLLVMLLSACLLVITAGFAMLPPVNHRLDACRH